MSGAEGLSGLYFDADGTGWTFAAIVASMHEEAPGAYRAQTLLHLRHPVHAWQLREAEAGVPARGLRQVVQHRQRRFGNVRVLFPEGVRVEEGLHLPFAGPFIHFESGNGAHRRPAALRQRRRQRLRPLAFHAFAQEPYTHADVLLSR